MPLLPQVWRSESVAKVSYSMFPLHLHFCFLGTGGMAGVSGLWTLVSGGTLSQHQKTVFSGVCFLVVFVSSPVSFPARRGGALVRLCANFAVTRLGLSRVLHSCYQSPFSTLSHIIKSVYDYTCSQTLRFT